MLIVAIAGPARAQVEVCAETLTLDGWRETMDQVDDALVRLDGARSEGLLDDLERSLHCLDVPAPTAEVGRMARQVALVAFFAQDQDELAYWGLLARETLGDAPWPDRVPVPARFVELLAALPEPEAVTAEGGLVVPKGGGAFLDGRPLLGPTATAGVQHLFQVADKKGAVTFTGWQTGPAFPEDLRGDPATLSVPRWYVAPPVPVPVPEAEPVSEAPAPESLAPTVTFDGTGAAADCPWSPNPTDVTATGASITIAGVTYPVKHDADRLALHKVLRICGEFRAAHRLSRWRDAHGKPFAGARHWRDLLVQALETPEPKKRKKPATAPAP